MLYTELTLARLCHGPDIMLSAHLSFARLVLLLLLSCCASVSATVYTFQLTGYLSGSDWIVNYDVTLYTTSTYGGRYIADSATGTRTFTNTTTHSVQTANVSLAPTYTVANNLNALYPYAVAPKSSNALVDQEGIGFDLSSYEYLAGYTNHYTQLGLRWDGTQYIEQDVTGNIELGVTAESFAVTAIVSSSSTAAPMRAATPSSSSSSAAPAPPPVSVLGDPMFVGLRGQRFQVHGVDGEVYNLIVDRQCGGGGGGGGSGGEGGKSGSGSDSERGSGSSGGGDSGSDGGSHTANTTTTDLTDSTTSPTTDATTPTTSTPHGLTLVNARFRFLSSGRCPAAAGPTTACWSHPGSYLGEVGVVSCGGGRLHVVSGGWSDGWRSVTLNGRTLAVGSAVTESGITVHVQSAYSLAVTTANFHLTLHNSDRFVNLAALTVEHWSELSSHGLLGQTWRTHTYEQAGSADTRHIQGTVDDYVERSGDLFGAGFVYGV